MEIVKQRSVWRWQPLLFSWVEGEPRISKEKIVRMLNNIEKHKNSAHSLFVPKMDNDSSDC